MVAKAATEAIVIRKTRMEREIGKKTLPRMVVTLMIPSRQKLPYRSYYSCSGRRTIDEENFRPVALKTWSTVKAIPIQFDQFSLPNRVSFNSNQTSVPFIIIAIFTNFSITLRRVRLD
jgi:hypothetical protein